MYEVKISNLGRTKANVNATFENEPTYKDLYALVRPHLFSWDISFINGAVFAGIFPVGECEIIEK